jgi:signal peptidase II
MDQLTKSWAVGRLTRESCSVPDACIDLIGPLRFRLSFNSGAAFSSFTGGGPVLGVIAFGMTIYLLYLSVTTSDRVLRYLFPVVGGGALGNLWDRVTRADDGFLSGKVVDFIDLQFWPIFNIADIAVVCGVAAVAVRLWRHPPMDEPVDAVEPM